MTTYEATYGDTTLRWGPKTTYLYHKGKRYDLTTDRFERSTPGLRTKCRYETAGAKEYFSKVSPARLVHSVLPEGGGLTRDSVGSDWTALQRFFKLISGGEFAFRCLLVQKHPWVQSSKDIYRKELEGLIDSTTDQIEELEAAPAEINVHSANQAKAEWSKLVAAQSVAERYQLESLVEIADLPTFRDLMEQAESKKAELLESLHKTRLGYRVKLEALNRLTSTETENLQKAYFDLSPVQICKRLDPVHRDAFKGLYSDHHLYDWEWDTIAVKHDLYAAMRQEMFDNPDRAKGLTEEQEEIAAIRALRERFEPYVQEYMGTRPG